MTEYQLKIIFVLVLCAPVVYFGFRFFISLLRSNRADSSSRGEGRKKDANDGRGQGTVRDTASQGRPAQLGKKRQPRPPRPARTRRPYRNRNRGL
jgi:hypothetical protein